MISDDSIEPTAPELCDGAHDHDLPLPGQHVPTEKVPAHWLMARLGKRVLRPGGRELTRWMIAAAEVGESDTIARTAGRG